MVTLNKAHSNPKANYRWGWGVLFYGLCVYYYSALILYDQTITERIKSLPNSTRVLDLIGFTTYGGKFKYLTTINAVLQSVYFSLSLLAHLTRFEQLRGVCEFIFGSAVLPLGTLVAAVFWVIYAINRELVYPSFLDSYLPMPLNHACHTIIVVLIVLDLLLIPHFRPRGIVAETLVVVFIVSCYATALIWIKYHAGFWVYPLFKHLTHFQFGLFILFIAAVMYGLQRFGVLLSGKWWVAERCKND